MTEIYLLGTFHFNDRKDIFSEIVQQQLEDITNAVLKLKINKIALEIPHRCQKQLEGFYKNFNPNKINQDILFGEMELYGEKSKFSYINEAVQIGFRLADKLGLSTVYGIDEDMALSDELAEKVYPYIQDDINKYYNFINNALSKTDGSIIADLKIRNSRDSILLDNQMYITANKVNLKNYEGSLFLTQWYERNLKIFSNLQNICEVGDRVFILYGSGHLKILQHLINSESSMKLMDICL